MLIISVFLSLVLIAAGYYSCRSERSVLRGTTVATSIAFLVASVLFAFLGACMMPALCLQALLTVPVLIVRRERRRAGYLLGYMVVAALLSYGFFVYGAVHQVAERQRLREQYAFESMEARLLPPRIHLSANSPPKAREQLADFEKKVDYFDGDFRAVMLERLHEESLETFINSPGFGAIRRIRPTERTLKMTLNRDDIPLQQPGPFPSSTLGDKDLTEPKDINLEPLGKMHQSGVFNFVYPAGFGLIVSRQKVAGFVSHQFSEVPAAKEWKLQSVELVGLLMHAEPVVYVSNELPRMDKLRKGPTRPLNVFEAAGIKRLQEGDDLFVRDTHEGLRMLGAVRSVKQCVECHDGERGDLLGAFSYTLQRVPEK